MLECNCAVRAERRLDSSRRFDAAASGEGGAGQRASITIVRLVESAATPASRSTQATTACPLDCPDACSLEVRIQDGRAVSIGGTETNPITQSYICSKVRRFPEHVYGPDRIRFPQVRVGRKGEGRFRRVTWDEALERIASRMRALAREGKADRIL